MMQQLMGIDYGSKLAGTTVVCYGSMNAKPTFVSSNPKQDADAFLLEMIETVKPVLIAIDAPLSLPMVYALPSRGDDFFYREADRKLKAMSPMFLGGLTARAMQFARQCSQKNIPIYETYPAALVRELNLGQAYDKKSLLALPEFCNQLNLLLKLEVPLKLIPNWHHADALLAWLSCCRKVTGRETTIGNAEEGVICF